jgi:hypothetical protein
MSPREAAARSRTLWQDIPAGWRKILELLATAAVLVGGGAAFGERFGAHSGLPDKVRILTADVDTLKAGMGALRGDVTQLQQDRDSTNAYLRLLACRAWAQDHDAPVNDCWSPGRLDPINYLRPAGAR